MLAIIKNNKKKFAALFVALALGGYLLLSDKKSAFNENDFDFEEVKIGNIRKIVNATGNIYPSDTIDVGSQISGIIKKVYSDYNDKVKKNQLLALVDTTVLQRELEQQSAALRQVKSQLRYVQLETNRARELYKNNYIPKTELDKIENELITAKENLKIVQLRYDNAKTQLNYAYIRSPIDGVITSREVNEGQTVAASFSAPVLFKVAKDLKKMNIETSVSESDISLIKEGSEVEFTVDAYKNKKFVGKIRQIRYDPVMLENVVIYNVIIEIDNSDETLLPGMTAYVSATISGADDVPILPNTTFRFKGTSEIRKAMELPPLSEEERKEYRELMKDRDNAVIYVLKDKKPKPILIRKGLSDITNTQIISDDVQRGDRVISAYLVKSKKK
ncbi:MAG: efflux RND transporter periplasmic adaptor subunit [Rickettsiales bacterium]|jgi:HlyD family secretion protein|nr:efflux RND transporter periplasmic adaptor subunit [Rickettsiales bacterium]